MSTATARTRQVESPAAQGAYADALLHLAALSIVAGAIHAVVAPPHFVGGMGLWDVLRHARRLPARPGRSGSTSRPSTLGFRIGAAVNVAVIGVWIVSRTTGMPLGPEPWQVESVGALDLAATAAEALIAVLCAAFLAGVTRRPGARWLPARFRGLHPVAMAVMFCGLLSLLLGGGHHVR